jgi:hypothetical protein
MNSCVTNLYFKYSLVLIFVPISISCQMSRDEFLENEMPKYSSCSGSDLCVITNDVCACFTAVAFQQAANYLEAIKSVHCDTSLDINCHKPLNLRPQCESNRCTLVEVNPCCTYGFWCQNGIKIDPEQACSNTDPICAWPAYPDDFECPTPQNPDNLCDTPNPP